MLEEVGTQPNIYYMTNVRNKEGGEVAVAHHAEAHSTEEHKTEKH